MESFYKFVSFCGDFINKVGIFGFLIVIMFYIWYSAPESQKVKFFDKWILLNDNNDLNSPYLYLIILFLVFAIGAQNYFFRKQLEFKDREITLLANNRNLRQQSAISGNELSHS